MILIMSACCMVSMTPPAYICQQGIDVYKRQVVFPLMTIVMALAQMLGDGAAAYMSLNLGKKKEEAAARGAANAMAASVFIGIILAVLFEIFMEPLCKLLSLIHI